MAGHVRYAGGPGMILPRFTDADPGRVTVARTADVPLASVPSARQLRQRAPVSGLRPWRDWARPRLPAEAGPLLTPTPDALCTPDFRTPGGARGSCTRG